MTWSGILENKRARLAGLLTSNPKIAEQVAVNNAVLGGLLGVGDEPSVMYPRAVQARRLSDLGGIISQAIPGEAIAGLVAKGISAMKGAPVAIGMLKTPFGRLPQTGSDVNYLADILERAGLSKGYDVARDRSMVSPSQYITFIGPGDVSRQVRISNHLDKYPELASGVRTSVDPSSEVTFEQAVRWLERQGFPTHLSKKYKDIPSYANAAAAGLSKEQVLQKKIDAWRNMPKATRGPMPTLDDV